MHIKKGFTLLELCVGIILAGIAYSILFSFFFQMHSISTNYFKKQLEYLKYSLYTLQEEQRLRSKCFLFYTEEEIKMKNEYKIKAAHRCRF